MAINISLRVTPEQLRTQKNIIDADLNNLRNDISQISNEVSGTAGYWYGEAGNKQRRDYEDSMHKINAMLDRLGTYPTRILQMAGIYEESETANTQTASQLKPDVQLI